MSQVSQSVKSNGLVLLVAGVALVGGLGLRENAENSTEKLAKAQVVACNLANEVRRESNRRVRSNQILKDGVQEFIKDSIDARQALEDDAIKGKSKTAPDQYRLLLKRIKSDVTYHRTPEVSCDGIVPL